MSPRTDHEQEPWVNRQGTKSHLSREERMVKKQEILKCVCVCACVCVCVCVCERGSVDLG